MSKLQIGILFLALNFISLSWADVVRPSARVVSSITVKDIETDATIGHILKGGTATYIDSIPNYYIIRLEDGTRGKVSKAWSEHIEGTTSSTLKIATFNIQIFGRSKANKPAVMDELASIVRQFDVVAIQEIKDSSQEVPAEFLSTINRDGSNYQFIISERGGKQADDQGSVEQYAFYYDTDKLKVIDSSALYDDEANDYFQREPFFARFASIKGSLTFVLMGKRIKWLILPLHESETDRHLIGLSG